MSKNRPIHKDYQRKSKRCISCGRKLLLYASKASSNCRLKHNIYSVIYSGGKISCTNCDVKFGNYCVHGVLLSESCEYCPENKRQHTLEDI